MKPKLMSYGIISLILCMFFSQAGVADMEAKGTDGTEVNIGNSYYVSTAGSNSNGGTLEKPFRTVGKGCGVLEPGDTLYIMAGEYNEKISVRKSGTRDRYITIQPYASGRVILSGKGIRDQGAIIYLEDASYVRIQGLELANSSHGDTPSGIMFEGSGTGIELIGNRIHSIRSDEDAHGIAIYGTDSSIPIRDVTISGNEVWNCILGSSESVVVNGNVEGFIITKNIIHDNDNIGIDCIGFEGTADKNYQARSGVVSENKVYNISSASNPAYEGDACADGIYVDGGKDIVIERNTVYNCDIGIEVASEHQGKSASKVAVRNNLVYGCGLYGLAFGGSSPDNGYAEYCAFQLNTLYNNEVGICIQKSRSNKVESNIIYGQETLLEGDQGSNTLKYNLWYSPEENPEGLSPFADPQFVAPLQQDFRLRKGSPGIDAGDPDHRAENDEGDILKRPRAVNGRVDCGAYEFQWE